jgi:hypothetical protein
MLFYQPILSFMVLSSADRYGIETQWCSSLVLFWSWWSYFAAFLTVVMECTFGPPKQRHHYDPGLISRFRCALDTRISVYGFYCGICDFVDGILDLCVYFIWIHCHTSLHTVVIIFGLAVASWLQWISVWLLESSHGLDTCNANLIVFAAMGFCCASLRGFGSLILFVCWDIPQAMHESISSSNLADLNYDITMILSKLVWSPNEDDPNDAMRLTMLIPAPTPPVQRVGWLKAKFFRVKSLMRFLICFVGLSSLTSSVAQPIHQDVVCFTTHDGQDPSLSSFSSIVCHKPDKLDWRSRRRWQRKSERIDLKGPNPFACMIPPPPPTVPTKAPQPLSSFD